MTGAIAHFTGGDRIGPGIQTGQGIISVIVGCGRGRTIREIDASNRLALIIGDATGDGEFNRGWRRRCWRGIITPRDTGEAYLAKGNDSAGESLTGQVCQCYMTACTLVKLEVTQIKPSVQASD